MNMNLQLVKKEVDVSADYMDDAMDFGESSMLDDDNIGPDEAADIAAAAAAVASGLHGSPVCKVCGDSATGMYFGALVCVPCKTFFLRYASDSFSFNCKFNKSCKITPSNRTQCKYCRYQKCLEAGMCRRVRPMQVNLTEGQQLCAVCSDVANGVHFGALTCEGCKKFFRRGLVEHKSYSCKGDMKCIVNPRTRNACRYCRYVKCLSVGMSRDAIQMGRPSKHKAQMNASMRQRVAKAASSEEESNFYCRTTTWRQRSSDSATLQSSPESAELMKYNVDWPPTDSHSELSPHESLSQRVSFDSPNMNNDVVLVNSDSNSSAGTDVNRRDSLLSSAHSDAANNALVDTVTDCIEKVPSAMGLGTSSSGTPGVMDGSDARFTVDWRNATSASDVTSRARVWSGGYCCEVSNVNVNCATNDSANSFMCNSDSFIQGKWSDAVFEDNQPVNVSAPSASVTIGFRDSEQLLANGTELLKTSNLSPVVNTANDRPLAIRASYPEGASSGVQSVLSPDDGVSSMHSPRQESPGLKWHLNSDRDSPYVSVMALASSYQMFSESGPGLPPEDMTEDSGNNCHVDQHSYWVEPELPDENVMFSEKHCTMINRITAAYDRFVQTGTIINQTLSGELKNWQQQSIDSSQNLSLPEWIQEKVIPVYTVTSITYCKSLPGFVDFVPEDQATVIRLGQSPSRILAACIHWYDPDRKDFHNFLSWRSDMFKKKLIAYAQKVHSLDIDHIEAAVLNALTLIATDYPGLKNSAAIREVRMSMLSAFRAYTTAKLGTPNRRIETLFSYIPDIRQLGMLHYKMTMTPSLGTEPLDKL